MKNVLVLAHEDDGQDGRIQAALDLVRALAAHLTCVDVDIVSGPLADFVSSGGGTSRLRDDQRGEEQNRSSLRQRLAHEVVPFDWVEATGDAVSCICDAAHLSDLIIVSCQLQSATFPDMARLVGGLLAKSGIPVLAIPEAASGCNPSGHALVAWDGSMDAEAALRASIPLLKLAAKVTLLYVEDASLELPIEDAVRYLQRYGIAPHVYTENILKDSAGTVILATAINQQADLVVMGGFGRGSLRERLFGGATRRMLQESPAPILLAHRCRD